MNRPLLYQWNEMIDKGFLACDAGAFQVSAIRYRRIKVMGGLRRIRLKP